MLKIDLDNPKITQEEKKELEKLLAMQNSNITNDLEQIWYLMDKIWDDMGCDNKKLDWEKIGKYYSHPIWLLNGLFIETHELSIQIREKLADYIAQQGFKHICDYGGGFGTLARNIAQKCPDATVYIYEPHPSRYGLECIKEYKNITFIDKLQDNFFDCIISTDVLEHVEYPIQTFQKIIKSAKNKSMIIMANCFYPCIKCHLPYNFHFRYTFDYFVQKMGVKKIGKIPHTHATIFLKTGSLQPFVLKTRHLLLSKIIFIGCEIIKPPFKFCFNLFRNIFYKIKSLNSY